MTDSFNTTSLFLEDVNGTFDREEPDSPSSGTIRIGPEPKDLALIRQISTVSMLVLSSLGILTNGLNVKIFAYTMRMEGPVSISLLALSLSDFFYCIFRLIVVISYYLSETETSFNVLFPVSPYAITIIMVSVTSIFYFSTMTSTTYLAVTRCMCVSRPLHFKTTFTRSRSIIAHVSFFVMGVAFYVPLLSQMGTTKGYDPRVKATRYMLQLSSDREGVKDIVDFICNTVVSLVTNAVVIVSVVVMTRNLRQSAQFRSSSSVARGQNSYGPGDTGTILSAKELQIVRQVVIISSIYFLCNVPKTFTSVYSLAEPDFDIGKRLHHLYFALNYLRNAFETLNSSTTFFIYLFYNSRFKASLSCHRGQNEDQ